MAQPQRRSPGTSGKARVRQFRPNDADETSVLMTEAFRSFLPGGAGKKILKNFSPERFRATSVYGKKDATSAAYVAELGGKVVGYVSGSINEYGFGTLSVIGVSPRIFHKGIGTLLMRKMVAAFDRGRNTGRGFYDYSQS